MRVLPPRTQLTARDVGEWAMLEHHDVELQLPPLKPCVAGSYVFIGMVHQSLHIEAIESKKVVFGGIDTVDSINVPDVFGRVIEVRNVNSKLWHATVTVPIQSEE